MPHPSDAVYRAGRGIIRRLLGVFFRRVMIEGAENVPLDRGGLLVASHPNGLIDPALMLAAFPGRVVFGARHGLFEWPLLGRLMRRMGAVPIYRFHDVSGLSAAEKMQANERSLDALSRELADGSYSALFPEGISHDLPHLTEIKTGAARLYYRARSLQRNGQPPVIIPVGLHYDRKNIFRSRVLVTFHPPLELPEGLDMDPGDDRAQLRRAVRGLTTLIEERLNQVVGSTEDWHVHHLIHRAGKLIRAEMAWRIGTTHRVQGLSERRLAYGRIWQGYKARSETDPERLGNFRSRISRYDRYLRALGLEDRELTALPRMASPWLILLFLIQLVAVYLLFPPILLVGLTVNILPYNVLRAVSGRISPAKKDEATVKLLGGVILFPLTWTLVAVAAWFAHQELRALFPSMPDVAVLVVLVTVTLSILGGYLALVYAELSAETLRALRVRFLRRRRKKVITQLVSERSALCDELLSLGEGLDLPGERLSDGRLVPG